MKKSLLFIGIIFCLGISSIEEANAQKTMYKIRIRNHLKVDAYDLRYWLKFNDSVAAPNGAKHSMQMTKNNGSMLIDSLWKKGKKFYKKQSGMVRHGKGPWHFETEFNIGGPVAVKPNKIAEFTIDLKLAKWYDFAWHNTLGGSYSWTDANGKCLGEWSLSVNNPEKPNWNIETFLVIPPFKPTDNSSTSGCSINKEDSVIYALNTILLHREELINLGYFEGVIPPGDTVTHVSAHESMEDGDSIFNQWSFENMRTGENWTVNLGAEIIKGTLYTPGDTIFWSEGEIDSSYVSYLGGTGNELRCLQMPEFLATDPTDEFVNAGFAYPNQLANEDFFNLTFIRTGRGIPGTSQSYGGQGTADTASCVVYHGDFRPTASWTNGDGSFEPVNDSIFISITVTRQEEESDWFFTDITGEHLGDTILFHHHISGLTNDLLLPIGFSPDELNQIDSLRLIVSTGLSPSSPDTLWANISRAQQVESLLLTDQINLHVYPNPVTSHINFVYDLMQSNSVVISIFDVNGRQIDQVMSSHHNHGKQQTTWMADHLPSGLYYYMIKVGSSSSFGKIFKL